MDEKILRDLTVADHEWPVVLLRYDNPVGTHKSGLIGEYPNGIPVPYEIAPHRLSNLATYYVDPSKSREVLGWAAIEDKTDMCWDTWNWQSKNPNGFDK